MKLTSLESKMGKNKRVSKFKDSVKFAKNKLQSIDENLDKALGIQVERVSSSLAATKVLKNAQYELSRIRLNNQAYRASIVSYKVECNVLYSQLEKNYRLIRKFISTMYIKDLSNAGYKTKTDRDAWVDSYFYNEIKFINKIEASLDTFDMIIEDIDSQGFAVNAVNQSLSIDYKHKFREE